MSLQPTTIGIELEYLGSASPVVDRMRANDKHESVKNISDQRGSYHTTFYDDRWVIGYDSTVNYEIKSHPIRQTDEIADVMAAIRQGGGRVNRRCGTHVHFGCTNFTLEQLKSLCLLWLRYEYALDQLQPATRRGNRSQWCGSNYRDMYVSTTVTEPGYDYSFQANKIREAESFLAIKNSFANGRYFKLNISNWERNGTIEFRGHAGTLNFRKIEAWISLLGAIWTKAQQGVTVPDKAASFSEMMDELVPTASYQRPAPTEGTKARRIWDSLDHELAANWYVFTEDSSRALRGKTLTGLGRRTLIQHLQDQGVSQAQATNEVSRWSIAKGISSRTTSNRGALRKFLKARKAALAS